MAPYQRDQAPAVVACGPGALETSGCGRFEALETIRNHPHNTQPGLEMVVKVDLPVMLQVLLVPTPHTPRPKRRCLGQPLAVVARVEAEAVAEQMHLIAPREHHPVLVLEVTIDRRALSIRVMQILHLQDLQLGDLELSRHVRARHRAFQARHGLKRAIREAFGRIFRCPGPCRTSSHPFGSARRTPSASNARSKARQDHRARSGRLVACLSTPGTTWRTT